MMDPYEKQQDLYNAVLGGSKKVGGKKTGTHARGNTFDNRVAEQKPQMFVFEKRPVSSNSKQADKKARVQQP